MSLETLATLAVGNALYNDIRGDLAVKKLVSGDVLIPQILGDDQDGGVLFQKLAPGGKAPMFKVGKDGAIGKKAVPAHEASRLTRPTARRRCATLWRSCRRAPAPKASCAPSRCATSASRRRPRPPKRPPRCRTSGSSATWPTRRRRSMPSSPPQTGTAIAIIDKRQALSGTNDFAKNVQRAVAIGAWEPHELDQFYKRLGRACELKEGNLVPKVFYGVHISSPFAANLVANAKERAADKAMLSDKAKKALDELKATAEKGVYTAKPRTPRRSSPRRGYPATPRSRTSSSSATRRPSRRASTCRSSSASSPRAKRSRTRTSEQQRVRAHAYSLQRYPYKFAVG